MNRLAVILSFVAATLHCSFPQERDSVKNSAIEYYVGLHSSTIDYLQYYFSYMVHTQSNLNGKVTGFAMGGSFGLNSIRIGPEYVARNSEWTTIHNPWKNKSIGIYYTRIFGKMMRAYSPGSLILLMPGVNFSIINIRLGYGVYTSEINDNGVFIFELGLMY